MTTDSPTTATAVAEHEAGRLDQAQAIYRARLAQYPDDLASLIGLADVLTDAGQLTEAEELYRKAIALDGDSPAAAGAYDGLAAIRQDLGDLDTAIPASKKAAVLRGNAEDSFGVASTLEYLGRNNDAIEMYLLAATQKPDFAQAHMKAAQHLLVADRAAEAIPHYEAAIEAHPEIAELHCNLANARRKTGELEKALIAVRKAVELKPQLPDAHNLLGAIWKDRRRPSDALASFKKAIELKPDYADAISNMGSVLEQAGQFDKAVELYSQAVALQPSAVQYHENLASNLLSRGDLERGFQENEWRRLKPTNPGSRPFPQPMWDGSDLTGRIIMLFAEQGFGDTIQFLRYVPLVAARGGTVMVECPPAVMPLVKRVPGVSKVISSKEPWPECHVQCALMSLPMIFRTNLSTIPAQVPYISADPVKVTEWGEKLKSVPGKKVGLVWAGSHTHQNDKQRSIAVDRFLPVTKVPGVSLISLQKYRPNATDRPKPPEGALDWTDQLNDFGDTAALIENLDLIITVDTAVAHLAGAMGKPVWVLLPHTSDWRWLRTREDSPWYPTARLFRQDSPGDWAGVIERVCSALV
jgi:tetratricopeptide (TPR) repeat protein